MFRKTLPYHKKPFPTMTQKLINHKNVIFSKVINDFLAMTNAQRVQIMIDALSSPATVIDMSSFGHYSDRTPNAICYGCAATNVLIKMTKWSADMYLEYYHDMHLLNDNVYAKFQLIENYYDFLRCGGMRQINQIVHPALGITTDLPYSYLPILEDNYTADDLQRYQNYQSFLTN